MCEGACVYSCGVFMRVRRGGFPGECRRGSFVESDDLLGSERGASPSLPRSTRTAGLIFALQQSPSASVVVRPAPRARVFRCQELRAGRRLSSLGSPELARASTVSGGRGSEGGSQAGKGVLPFAAGSRSSRVGSIVTCSGPAPPRRPAPSRSLACSLRRVGGAGTAGGGCAGAGSAGAVSAGLEQEPGPRGWVRGCRAER